MKNINKIKKLLKEYKEKLSLDDYSIDISIADDNHIMSDRQNNIKCSQVDYCAMIMNKNLDAQDFSFLVNRKALDKDLDDTVLHELLHILFWTYTDMVENVIDLTTLTETGKADMLQELFNREHTVIEKLIRVLK